MPLPYACLFDVYGWNPIPRIPADVHGGCGSALQRRGGMVAGVLSAESTTRGCTCVSASLLLTRELRLEVCH